MVNINTGILDLGASKFNVPYGTFYPINFRPSKLTTTPVLAVIHCRLISFLGRSTNEGAGLNSSPKTTQHSNDKD